MRWASLGVLPVVGSWVMSLTVMTPNCMPGQVVFSLMMRLRLYASEYTWKNACAPGLFRARPPAHAPSSPAPTDAPVAGAGGTAHSPEPT